MVSESNDGLLEGMLKATGNQATPEELAEIKNGLRRTTVKRREITYF
jgi:hypothetical protein